MEFIVTEPVFVFSHVIEQAGGVLRRIVTMFDGVGIGIQDTTVVRTIYDRAVELGLGARISFS